LGNYFSDPDGDALLFTATGLPASSGINFSPDGTVSGVPNEHDVAASPFTILITATDPSNAFAEQTLSVLVLRDSNGDGLSDQTAVAIGLDPNVPDGDTDGDGVRDVVEIGGNPGAPLDSDGDGRIDALEPGNSANDASWVASLPLPAAGTVDIFTAPGESLSNIAVSEAPATPAGVTFPSGILNYTTSSPIGGSVATRLTFSRDLPARLTVYKIDKAGVFAELPTRSWRRVDAKTIEVTLTDGDPLTDLDGLANGSIDDPIAVADAGTATGTVGDSGSGGGGGCTAAHEPTRDPILILMALISLLYVGRSVRGTQKL